MSVINKLSNKPIPNNSSFMSAPVKNNSIKNISQSFALPESITGPINESINGAFGNSETPFLSVTVIVVLGILILALILIVIFREQVAIAMELAWRKIKGLFSPPPPPPTIVPDEPASPAPAPAPAQTSAIVEKILPGKKEVFNIVQDKYTYSDAEPLCKAFGAELATYDQVKEAWGKGADWCNYGWVKGQAAVYPTQEETYKKLQAGPEGQRGSCGIPGINGGTTSSISNVKKRRISK